MIVVLENPSHGVGMEIERALSRPARGLPEVKILGLISKGKRAALSKMISGASRVHKNFVLKTYKTTGQIESLVKDFLESGE